MSLKFSRLRTLGVTIGGQSGKEDTRWKRCGPKSELGSAEIGRGESQTKRTEPNSERTSGQGSGVRESERRPGRSDVAWKDPRRTVGGACRSGC